MTQSLYPAFGVLLVDDEPSFLRSLGIALERSGGINHIHRCHDSREVMEILARENIGLVTLDLTMPHLSGEELLARIVEEYPDVGVIVVSGLNQVESAVSCIKLGAFDYFVKTDEESRLVEGIRRAIRLQELRQENQALRRRVLDDTLERPEAFAHIVTADKGMRAVFQYLESVALTQQPILISGESGVGKELIAKAAHTLSGRRGPLVCVNVAGLDDNVFADTLFGHQRGAFTGAEQPRAGMIEQAAGGTLLLDEIGDLSLASQVKLLRLLQEGEYYPLGSDRPKRLQARVVVATHHDLAEKQRAGTFRKDLYYRLRTHQVHIPPLRQRKQDIALLLDHFLAEAAAELGKGKPSYPPELAVLLGNYAFPGNVRELRAMAYDAMSQHRSRTLSMAAFKRAIDQARGDEAPLHHRQRAVFAPDEPLPTLDEVADLLVEEAMQRAEGNQTMASRWLGISQPALSKRLKKRRDEGA
ncbi:sigma-54-dependent Fis family transcriptional regulator [Halomonas sp. MCCC 1A17488]|uniref:Sigma-54-dependent Fis family transcriptional regulator n=1 Tax=Billgrantia sulfidoxydans TaxID=2733484 RepID=A0ABX7WA72_9GAMM|nr:MULTISPECIES: sigma-54 dependent transcriptional regulator [Halomonas]MCE8017334.1 sigma-54-dependent Fis family transcriptional regulator [Halomonas sp. MCCC 1A17488]MCG3240667.1 sigma-54-dependent Fis family transcriptional regulator [Halomonas sp. MCCC 1A17488]QPP49491.1 sigma-54-dependent Fis family transcriptional regulator [Halomonas sp. SS10-MC5]QTP56846.1 sigma-54-dependent Fis family transcriptional regulator [Halomonas sulfidoxydans]